MHGHFQSEIHIDLNGNLQQSTRITSEYFHLGTQIWNIFNSNIISLNESFILN